VLIFCVDVREAAEEGRNLLSTGCTLFEIAFSVPTKRIALLKVVARIREATGRFEFLLSKISTVGIFDLNSVGSDGHYRFMPNSIGR
jgi:hypothetical protein